MNVLVVRSLRAGYGDVVVLDGFDLELAEGEGLALLGPSGSGKTTLLHCIAGFVTPTAGSVSIDGRVVASPEVDVAPERRPVAMVFQHYALWPHLRAWENVAFPLRRQGRSASEARREALELMERLGIGRLADRRPAELSGGQQQRVGLARALARDARLFLFDEPTAHLDTELRIAVQEEIADRRRQAGAAAVYATHDAAEALAVADRVALVRDGRVVQSGTPRDVYERPVDLWAARLTGPASVVDLVVAVAGHPATVEVAGRTLPLRLGGAVGPGRYRAVVRPEWVHLGGGLPGSVTAVWYRGSYTDYRLATPVGILEARALGAPRRRVGDRVGVTLERAWVVASVDAPGAGRATVGID